MTLNGLPDTTEITDFRFTVTLTDFNFIYFRYYYADYINLFGPQLKILETALGLRLLQNYRRSYGMKIGSNCKEIWQN